MKTTMRKAALGDRGAGRGRWRGFRRDRGSSPPRRPATGASSSSERGLGSDRLGHHLRPRRLRVRRRRASPPPTRRGVRCAGRRRGSAARCSRRVRTARRRSRTRPGRTSCTEWQVGKVGSVTGATVTLTDGTGADVDVDYAVGHQVPRRRGEGRARRRARRRHDPDPRHAKRQRLNDATAVFDPNPEQARLSGRVTVNARRSRRDYANRGRRRAAAVRPGCPPSAGPARLARFVPRPQSPAITSRDRSRALASAATVKNAGVAIRPVSILRSVSTGTPDIDRDLRHAALAARARRSSSPRPGRLAAGSFLGTQRRSHHAGILIPIRPV